MELYHYGTPRHSGRYPWGSGDRPYQRSAKKLLDKSVSAKTVHKKLKRQIRKERSKQQGFSNRWMSQTPIGPESRKVVEEDQRRYKEYVSSPKFKEYSEKYNALTRSLDKKLAETDSSTESWAKVLEEYEEKAKQLEKERPKVNWNTLSYAKIVFGRSYTNNFINKGGKDLTVAYLKDLGYNAKDIERLVDKMLKDKRTLGDV